jgi:hypothetical protein
MDIIHRPKSKILKIKKLKSRRFRSWLCFRPQVNGGGEDSSDGRWLCLRGSTEQVFFSSPPEGRSRASFRNVVILIFNFLIFNILLFGRWLKSIQPSPQNNFSLIVIY